ncbi:MAG: hypothetical protein JXO22_02190 [Phycisphaerae bacterium]|nr:hypothetical protein [Phycisphaerae bacterium]
MDAQTPPKRVIPSGLCTILWLANLAPTLADSVFTVNSFASPAWSIEYPEGFTGTVGTTTIWPGEMGWEGDQIDIAFNLPASVPANTLHYRFRIAISLHVSQTFDLTLWAGPTLAELQQVHSEFIDSARVYAATIPLDHFTPGQTNWIRIKGVGAQVGEGLPTGIQWSSWSLRRTVVSGTIDSLRLGQLQRCTFYLMDAIQANGMVRDSLPLSPSETPFHPATPDAAGFALLGLCAADQLEIISFSEPLVESILSAYSGHTPGITPDRSADGHWVHCMDVNTGQYSGWDDTYTTIGSALLVSGALFAKNHFPDNATIASYADEMFATTNFDAAIDPSLNGRVYLGMAPDGGGAPGTLPPWNEYVLVVSLALREPGATRAPAIAHLWLDPANTPTKSYRGIPTLTDNTSVYAPAFWVHQSHFFNADFARTEDFEQLFRNQQYADSLYSSYQLGQPYRYGLTAGVDPSGYNADRMYDHENVFGPEAVAAWGDIDALFDFLEDQPPTSDSRLRYGATRVSSQDASWLPYDAGLVDHTFLMFGLVESIEPLFFKARQPFQLDTDADGIADVYDNCVGIWNRAQQDSDGDGIGDACDCGLPFADADIDGDVDLGDIALMQLCPAENAADPESCLCFDRDGDRVIDDGDLGSFFDCLDASGPEVPADPGCGN